MEMGKNKIHNNNLMPHLGLQNQICNLNSYLLLCYNYDIPCGDTEGEWKHLVLFITMQQQQQYRTMQCK